MTKSGVITLMMAALLASCSAPRPAPIDDRARSVREPDTDYRTVVRGDTLYSIAWETGRDFRELAAWNRIAPPYTLQPGQQIRVKAPKTDTAADARTITPPKRAAAPPPTASTTPTQPKRSAPTDRPKTTPEPGKSPTKPAPPSPPASVKTPTTASGGWSWPAQGKLVGRFSDNSNSKGIDIGGTAGQPVMAAAPGRVVYQGSGLRGYGRLIIVKHNDEFLSAYAHNDKIFVKEGDTVKRGQRIASMGATGTDRVKLHFEIRRNGVPIDPLKYLPRK